MNRNETMPRAMEHVNQIIREEAAVGLDDWNRCGGDVTCNICNYKLYDHPKHPFFEWLKVLCDGSVVKL